MAQLVKLAKRFQRALDNASDPLTSPAASADAAGQALMKQTDSLPRSSRGGPASRYLEPLVRKTQLLPSIVAYLERIRWAAVTPQKFVEISSEKKALTACVDMLLHLCFFPTEPEYSGRNEMAGTVLRQVRTRLRVS